MTLTRITAPAGLITLAEAKDHLRVTGNAEDAYINGLVAVASGYLDARDGVLGEALAAQTWRYAMDAPPLGSVALPLGPVLSITSVNYLDEAEAPQVFASANYRLVDGSVELVTGADWPDVANRTDAFWVDYVAGYTAIPETSRHLCKLMVADLYEMRASTSNPEMRVTPAFQMLLQAARSARGLF
jgi:uncharacterized phiE125 gp8 family phage protein